MKIRVIERDNLSLWKRTFDVDIREYNRQIKELEDENKRYKKEISQLNRVLRQFK
jgi:predicted RNase H-like nuclease (RuvC/YqgF family)